MSPARLNLYWSRLEGYAATFAKNGHENDIQFYPDELDYVNTSRKMRSSYDESFLGTFFLACLRADAENYELLRPALKIFMEKYPADPRLAAERS